jgi:hypothetical protein
MQSGTCTPDNLIAGDYPRVTEQLAIPAGVLKRGTVVTRAGTAYVAEGGNAFAVLAEDADASGGAVVAPIYLSGHFARAHLILADNAAISDADWDALRVLNIYVKDTVPAA